MNILHIAPYYPSIKAVHAGGVTMGHEIETIRKLGHNVYILSFVQKKYDYELFCKEKRESDTGILIGKIEKLKNVLQHPFVPIEFATRINLDFYKKIIKYIDMYRIDCVHAEYSSMLWYVRIKNERPNVKFVIVLHDVVIQSYYRKYINERNFIYKIAYKIESWRIRNYEYNNLTKCDIIMSFSRKDKALIKSVYKLDSIAINTYFDLENIQKKRHNIHRLADGYRSVCFIGQMGRRENHDAAMRLISIFKKIDIAHKKLYIIGAFPRKELDDKKSDDIIITGFIDDIDTFILRKCDIACFPLVSGAGIKIKVLKCLALGIPVITNKIGAEGIDEDGKFVKLAETDTEFIKSIFAAKHNDFNYIEKFDSEFSWKKTEESMAKIYGNIL